MLIYKWTNKLNGKVYIGQTTKTLSHRTRMHVNTANVGSKMAIHSAIRKYGIEAFIIETLSTHTSREELDKAEVACIKQFNCLAPKGYNLKLGGDSAVWHTESRQKARVSALKRIEADGGVQLKEALTKGREALKGKDPWNKGKKVTDPEVLNRLSISHLGQTAWNKKEILCNETGEIFESLRAAAKALDLNVSKICLVLKMIRKHTGGYTFSYIENQIKKSA